MLIIILLNIKSKNHPSNEWQGHCNICFTQGMVIDALGRKVLITGGYILMSICCILFTLSLTFQVLKLQTKDWPILFELSVEIIVLWCVFFFSQDASPVLSYLSAVCVFGFILSFGLGPGNWISLSWTVQVSCSKNSVTRFSPFVWRWRDQHLDHRVIHTNFSACSLHDHRNRGLVQLLPHRHGLSFYCGRYQTVIFVVSDLYFWMTLCLIFFIYNVWFFSFLHSWSWNSTVSWYSWFSAPRWPSTFC